MRRRLAGRPMGPSRGRRNLDHDHPVVQQQPVCTNEPIIPATEGSMIGSVRAIGCVACSVGFGVLVW
jgi:hypothetical protein